MDESSHLAPGFLVGGGRFTLVRELGRGGMSIVWLAQDERLNEPVALKFLPDAICNDPDALNQFRQETQKSRKLAHPNIIRIYDLYEAPVETPFLSMEFVDGHNLHELKLQQKQGLFSWDELKPLVRQLCEALDYAHAEKVIHRDLKPANMMVDKRNRLKLADFGIAAIDVEATFESGGHRVIGTLDYMSPQHLEGAGSRITDDIYALGATLYELLTSRPPFFDGDIARKIQTMPAAPVQKRLAELKLQNPIPDDVNALIMACLAKDPAQRPQNARTVADRIAFGSSQQQPLPIPAATVIPEIKPETKPETIPETRPKSRSPNVLLRASAIVLSLVLVGCLAWFVSGIKTRPPSASNTNSASSNDQVETDFHTTNIVDISPDQNDLPWYKKLFEKPAPPPAHAVSASEGLLDPAFDPRGGPDKDVRAILTQLDGKIIIGGLFTTFNGQNQGGIVRLNPDGSVDKSANAMADGMVQALAFQPDGKILMAGDFNHVNGKPRRSIARLNPDMSLDASFDSGKGANREIRSMSLLDGRIFIAGGFNIFDGHESPGGAELNSYGMRVRGLTLHAKSRKTIWAILCQPDGQVLYGTEFQGVAGIHDGGVMRLNQEGGVDTSFDPHVQGLVYALALQPDLKILVGGVFKETHGQPHSHITRLNPNGHTDKDFQGVANGSVQTIVLQSDWKILIGGTFTQVNGTVRDHIARLNPNGSLDTTFDPKGFGVVVRKIAVQRDGKILVGGFFDEVEGVPRTNIVRLNSSPAK